MRQTSHTIVHASLIEALVLGSLVALCFLLPTGCATLSAADKAGVALCQLWQASNPPPSTGTTIGEVTCAVGEATEPWVQAAELAAAKPNAQAAVEALAAHPPLSSAAALALPCLTDPSSGPQSRIDRKLYPVIVVPPSPGE
jgi:hypothetical protein